MSQHEIDLLSLLKRTGQQGRAHIPVATPTGLEAASTRESLPLPAGKATKYIDAAYKLKSCCICFTFNYENAFELPCPAVSSQHRAASEENLQQKCSEETEPTLTQRTVHRQYGKMRRMLVRTVLTLISGTFSLTILYQPPLSQLSQPKAASTGTASLRFYDQL
jgi:hypothetical protein